MRQGERQRFFLSPTTTRYYSLFLGAFGWHSEEESVDTLVGITRGRRRIRTKQSQLQRDRELESGADSFTPSIRLIVSPTSTGWTTDAKEDLAGKLLLLTGILLVLLLLLVGWYPILVTHFSQLTILFPSFPLFGVMAPQVVKVLCQWMAGKVIVSGMLLTRVSSIDWKQFYCHNFGYSSSRVDGGQLWSRVTVVSSVISTTGG